MGSDGRGQPPAGLNQRSAAAEPCSASRLPRRGRRPRTSRRLGPLPRARSSRRRRSRVRPSLSRPGLRRAPTHRGRHWSASDDRRQSASLLGLRPSQSSGRLSDKPPEHRIDGAGRLPQRQAQRLDAALPARPADPRTGIVAKDRTPTGQRFASAKAAPCSGGDRANCVAWSRAHETGVVSRGPSFVLTWVRPARRPKTLTSRPNTATHRT